jgi:hypothetical protein
VFLRRLILGMSLVAAGCSVEPPPVPVRPHEVATKQSPPALPEDIADGAFPFPLPIAAAEQILSATGVFDMGSPGFAPGRQVQAFNVVLDQPDARERFRRLTSTGREAGAVYGLCGLLLVARDEGVNLAHSLSLRTGAVSVRDGDFTFDTPMARAILLVFADEIPRKLVERRAAADARFRDAR